MHAVPGERQSAQDDPWILRTTERDPWLRGYLGNGRLGVQLVADGALAGASGEPLHLMAELYDRAEGFEVEHPVPLPGWSGLRVRADGDVLDTAAASGYEQALDLRRGLARTSMEWQIAGGSLSVTMVQLVLRQEPNLALTLLSLGATVNCRVSVKAEVRPHEERGALRRPEAGMDAEYVWLAALTRERAVPLAVAAWLGGESLNATRAPASASLELALGAGERRELTWLVAVRSGAGALEVSLADIRRGRAAGTQRLLADHEAAWERLWQSDIRIDGEVEAQRFARAGLFALLGSARDDVPASIAPMGLSSLMYNGHIFWDADTWMLPPLLFLHPGVAQAMLKYRQQRLPAARTRAGAEGYAGAMFPWESATDGQETTPVSIARTGLKEHHITACVALAHWQYFLATGDRDWLARCAWPVLEGAAEFWLSRVTHSARGYEIRDVIAADEYAEDVDNDAFTNGAARAALLAAVAASRLLGRTVPAAWQTVAENLVLARDGDLVLEYDGYDGRIVKQGDVDLLTFPLEHPLAARTIALSLDTYRRATDVEGPAMGRSISAVVAAQLGRREQALSLFKASYEPHLWGPFYSLAETRSNGEVNFLTGVGGALQALLFGFAGLRLHADTLAVDPLLPAAWTGLHFPSLHWRRYRLALSVLPDDRLELSLLNASVPLTIGLRRWRRGDGALALTVRADADCRVTLTCEAWAIEKMSLTPQGLTWLLQPPDRDLDPFLLLSLDVAHAAGSFAFAFQQRVTNDNAG